MLNLRPRWLMVLSLALSAAGCKDSGVTIPPPPPPPPPPVVVDHIEVTPQTFTLIEGQTKLLSGKARDADNLVVPNIPLLWASSVDSIASVDQNGLVTAHFPGSSEITAAGANRIGLSVVTVPVPGVVSVTVTPNTGNVEIGDDLPLTVKVLDILGRTVTVPAVWSSNNSAIASVTSDGVVSGITLGSVQIKATVGGISGTADLLVIPTSVGKVTVSPHSLDLFVGEAQPLTVRVESPRGIVLTDRTIAWLNRNPVVATVSSTGQVNAVTPGATWLVASADGVLDSALVTVSIKPIASYQTEIVNHLLYNVGVAINGADVATLPPETTLIIVRPPEDSVRVAWAIIPPDDGTNSIGEAVTDVFPQTTGVDGTKLHYDIKATLNDGRRIVIPVLKNLSGTTVLVGPSQVQGAAFCSCFIPTGPEEVSSFGYWFLSGGQSLRIYRRSDFTHLGVFLTIPILPADVDSLSGAWHFTITSGP